MTIVGAGLRIVAMGAQTALECKVKSNSRVNTMTAIITLKWVKEKTSDQVVQKRLR